MSLRVVAELMEVAARTAPKSAGQDFVVVKTVTGEGLRRLGEAMLAYGEQVGLDPAELETCITEGRYKLQIETEGALAQQLGFVEPSSFVLVDTQINAGIPIQGLLTAEKFDEAIQQLLNPPTPTPQATPTP